MDSFVLEQKTFDRTQEWNDAGYTGKDIVIWDVEGLNSHGEMTFKRILDAAPDAKVLNYGINMKSSNKGLEYEYVLLDDGTQISSDEFVKNNGVTILSHSHSGHNNNKKYIIELYKNLQEKYNVALFNSAGNTGEAGPTGAIPESLAIYVGAAIVFKHDFNDIRMASYSAIGDEFEEVDFTTFVGPAGWSGTSFSCPYLAGIGALLQQRYGKDITQQEIYQYFKMIAKPIDTGHKIKDNYDSWSGYGIPILPHVDKKLIRMKIGETTYKVDNELRTMDVAPIINLQHTFVPVAFVALALGAKVEWNAKDRSVTITKNGKIVKMWIGNEFYHINGKPYHMDVAPFIRNSRTLVPIAFVAEALGCKVGWVANMREVMILEG